jgi:hypothetical protein
VRYLVAAVGTYKDRRPLLGENRIVHCEQSAQEKIKWLAMEYRNKRRHAKRKRIRTFVEYAAVEHRSTRNFVNRAKMIFSSNSNQENPSELPTKFCFSTQCRYTYRKG